MTRRPPRSTLFPSRRSSDLPSSSTEKNKQIKTWRVANLSAIKRGFASPTWNELTPSIYFAPSEFEMEGYKGRSEEHTSELQSRRDLVCRLLLEKKKKK